MISCNSSGDSPWDSKSSSRAFNALQTSQQKRVNFQPCSQQAHMQLAHKCYMHTTHTSSIPIDHVSLTNPSFARRRRWFNQMYIVMGDMLGCQAVKLYFSNSLWSSVHTIFVTILCFVRLKIKRKLLYYHTVLEPFAQLNRKILPHLPWSFYDSPILFSEHRKIFIDVLWSFRFHR